MEKINEAAYRLDLSDIHAYLKNREPLLFIDEVVVEPGKRASMVKTLAEDEWYFACHFPGNPMMPGAFQLETMFQTAAMAIKVLDGYRDKTTNLARVTGVRYIEHIRPGDTIAVDAQIKSFRRGIAAIEANIRVREKLCCEAQFVLAVLDDIPDMGGRGE